MTKVAELLGHTERVLYMAMSPDGSVVVSATDAKTLMEIWAFAKPQSAPPSSPTQLCQLQVSLKLCFRHIFNEDKLNKFRKSLCPFI